MDASIMPEIHSSTRIAGVQIVQLDSFGDERGRFREIFRKEWFPQRSWQKLQSNCSQSAAGVLRGLHYHFHQVDYWYVAAGRLRGALYDLRTDSPTCGMAEVVEMGGAADIGLFIPVGVAHGFVALTDVTMIYIVDNYYDGSDEFGVRWDDPELSVHWDVTEPIISERDRRNPLLREIGSSQRPRMTRG